MDITKKYMGQWRLTNQSMKVKDILKSIDIEPKSRQVNKRRLMSLLCKTRVSVLLCFHNWIYWKFGDTTRLHRVCSKCYKKQQNKDVIKPGSSWSKDLYYD